MVSTQMVVPKWRITIQICIILRVRQGISCCKSFFHMRLYCVQVFPLACHLSSHKVGQLSSSSLSSPATSSLTLSRSSSSIVGKKISDNLSLLPASSTYHPPSSTRADLVSTHVDMNQRPIVLIYAWLGAKSRHIHKFAQFYNGTFSLCTTLGT